jgi:hypothetical protein
MRASLQYNDQIKKSADGKQRLAGWRVFVFLTDYQSFMYFPCREVIDL